MDRRIFDEKKENLRKVLVKRGEPEDIPTKQKDPPPQKAKPAKQRSKATQL